MYGKIDFFLVIKWFFKLLLMGLILLVVGIFSWRFSVSRVPEELKVLSPDEALAEAYAEHGEELELVVQEQNTTTRGENNYGYFTASQVIFIPEANQVQVLVRYNDSTLEATEKDYGLAEKSLEPEKDWYDITLLVMRDKTPEDSTDNLLKELDKHRDAIGFERIRPSQVSASMHSGLHSYRRLIFNDVSLDDETLAVFADFYFKDDIRYLAEDFDVYVEKAYGALCLYAYTEECESIELGKKDIEAIEAYMTTK